jgi:hypothetical protein
LVCWRLKTKAILLKRLKLFFWRCSKSGLWLGRKSRDWIYQSGSEVQVCLFLTRLCRALVLGRCKGSANASKAHSYACAECLESATTLEFICA